MGLLGLGLPPTKSDTSLMLIHLISYAWDIYISTIDGYTNFIATSQRHSSTVLTRCTRIFVQINS